MQAVAVTNLQEDELRQKAARIARQHKASWIELGQYLYTIQKNKMFKYWGYLEFDHYCVKELGIKPLTGVKMLRSYQYLEREEPKVIRAHFSNEDGPQKIPNYESVNILRLARNHKQITPKDVETIREDVFESAKEPKEVRARLKRLLSDREVKDLVEVRRSRRNTAIRRLVSVLAHTRKELEKENLLPAYLLNQIDRLGKKLEDQIEG